MDKIELKAKSLLEHGISYLDQAAKLAIKANDIDRLIKIHRSSLKTADRLLSLEIHLEGEEDEQLKTSTGGFGFIGTTQSECEPEENDE